MDWSAERFSTKTQVSWEHSRKTIAVGHGLPYYPTHPLTPLVPASIGICSDASRTSACSMAPSLGSWQVISSFGVFREAPELAIAYRPLNDVRSIEIHWIWGHCRLFARDYIDPFLNLVVHESREKSSNDQLWWIPVQEKRLPKKWWQLLQEGP